MSVVPFVALPPRYLTEDAVVNRRPVDIESLSSIDRGSNVGGKVKQNSVEFLSGMSDNVEEEDEDYSYQIPDIASPSVEEKDSESTDNEEQIQKKVKIKREQKLFEDHETVGCFTVLSAFILRKRKEYRDQRLHYIVQEYKKKIIEFEALRKQQILDEIVANDLAVQNEIDRMKVLKARYEKERERKSRGNAFIEASLAKRKAEAKKLEFLCFATQAWAADNYERRITRELDAAEQREKAANIAREKARVDHERSLADADAAELEKDVLTTNSMLEYQRRHGDIAAVPRDKAINPPLENLSTLTVVDFSLREGRDTDEAEPTTASRQKRRKKISAFTVDLSLTRQAAMVRGHKLGVNGATALAAELSTGACPKMSVLDLSRCELKSKGLGRLLRGIKSGNLLNLSALRLRGNGIGPRGVEFLKDALEAYALEHLKLLDLRENELGDEGATVIAHMLIGGSIRNIQELLLQRNSISDIGFRKIVTVLLSTHDSVCPLLEKCSLNENKVSSHVKLSFQPYPLYLNAYQTKTLVMMLTAIGRAAELISMGTSALQKDQRSLSRDLCLKALTLVELVELSGDSNKSEANLLACASYAIQQLVRDLDSTGEDEEKTTASVTTADGADGAQPPHSDAMIARREVHPVTRFTDIVGNALAKQALYESCVLPTLLTTAGCSVSNGWLSGIRSCVGNVMLYGPPGTGKTLLAQAVANECGATLFAVRPSDVLSKYQGESERYLRDLFDNAQRLRKAIIFFDEFDSIAVARGRLGSEEGHSRRLLAELLIQLSYNRQKFQPSTREDESKQSSEVRTSVCIIAATNRIEDIDDAILRRFDSKIGVHLPSHDDRVELLESFLEGIDTNLSEDDMHQVAGMTQDWSGSDLESLCREAAMNPMRSVLSYLTGNVDPTMSIPAVTIRDFEVAFGAQLKPMSLPPSMILYNENEETSEEAGSSAEPNT